MKFPKNRWTAIVHNFVTPNRQGRGSERVKTAGAPLRRECEACSVPIVDAADFDKLGESEKRHFYKCTQCGEMVDRRQLDDVLFHEADHNPRPDIQYGGSVRVE
jgi:hypothetical protein